MKEQKSSSTTDFWCKDIKVSTYFPKPYASERELFIFVNVL